jgi:hypothetical protein
MNKEKIKQRLSSNIQIVQKLSELIIKYPDQRFGQILINYGFIETKTDLKTFETVVKDPFYEESIDTLKRVKNGGNIKGTNEH